MPAAQSQTTHGHDAPAEADRLLNPAQRCLWRRQEPAQGKETSVKLLRRQQRPRAKSFRPAERHLIAAAAVARRLGHRYIGTEHLLHGLVHSEPNAATALLRRLDVPPAAVAAELQRWLGEGQPAIDPHALATLGIDYDAVVTHLGGDVRRRRLERTQAACLSICPRAKVALAFAVDYAGDHAVGDDHLLLGMLRVPDCVASRILTQHGVSLDAAAACQTASGER